jgi:hypothetical protein
MSWATCGRYVRGRETARNRRPCQGLARVSLQNIPEFLLFAVATVTMAHRRAVQGVAN